MEQRRRKKLEDKKRKMEWRVWKKKVIVFLWSYTLLGLELDSFEETFNLFYGYKVDVSSDN